MGYCQYDNSAILGQLFNFLKSTFQLFKIPKLISENKFPRSAKRTFANELLQNELVRNELAQIEGVGSRNPTFFLSGYWFE